MPGWSWANRFVSSVRLVVSSSFKERPMLRVGDNPESLRRREGGLVTNGAGLVQRKPFTKMPGDHTFSILDFNLLDHADEVWYAREVGETSLPLLTRSRVEYDDGWEECRSDAGYA